MDAARTKVEGIINDNAVVIFSKTTCKFCSDSKELLTGLGAKFYTVELNQVDDGAALQEALRKKNGQRTVPNIYIQQKHIGGFSDLETKQSELPELLKSAGAI